MNEALIQNAEHDIDRDDGRQDQQRLVAEAILEDLGRTSELPDDGDRYVDLPFGSRHRGHGLAECKPRRDVEGYRHGW